MNKYAWKFSVLALLIFAACAAISVAQQPNPQMMQEKLAAVKQAAAANQTALHQYKWTESMQVSMGNFQRPPEQFACQYGPDGKVQKTPVGTPPQAPSGVMKGGIMEAKIEQMKEYMGQVQALVHQYVPPDPELLQKAYAAGNVTMNQTSGAVQMNIKNYIKNGDSMTFSLDESTKKMSNLNISTYVDNPSEPVTVAVQFGSLPDGTNYPSQTTMTVAAKNLTVTTTNSNYQKIGG